MKMVNKVLKIVEKILLSVFVLAVVFLMGMTIIHTVFTSKEKGKLDDYKYINTVNVNVKKLNYNAYGNRDGEHMIVCI